MNLTTIPEIARECGVTPPAVWNWARRYEDFPKPVNRFGRSWVFDREAVQEWKERNGR